MELEGRDKAAQVGKYAHGVIIVVDNLFVKYYDGLMQLQTQIIASDGEVLANGLYEVNHYCICRLRSWAEKNKRAFAELQMQGHVSRDTRERVLKRDSHHCVTCGAVRNLAVHHIFPGRLGGPPSLINLITLCPECHKAWEMNFRHCYNKLFGFKKIFAPVVEDAMRRAEESLKNAF